MSNYTERRGHVQVTTFGPGYMEGIELRVWVDHPKANLDRKTRFHARVVGTVELDCGNTQHRVEVDERDQAWEGQPGEFAESIRAAEVGIYAAQDRVAEQLVEWALEDWSCSCEHEALTEEGVL
jgi:hypothetical protein